MSRVLLVAGLSIAAIAAFFWAPSDGGAAGDPNVAVATAAWHGDDDNSGCGSGNSGVKVTVTVSGLEGEVKWRDIHFKPAHKKRFGKVQGAANGTTVSDNSDPTGNQETWSVSQGRSGSSISIYAGSNSGFGNGTYSFIVCTKDGKKTGMHPVTWDATKNGAKTYTALDVIDDNEDKPAPNFPQFTWSLDHPASEDGSIEVAIGSSYAMDLECDAEAAGLEYEIYSSMQEGDGPDGVGVLHQTHPVPSSLGITFQNFSGTIVYDQNTGGVTSSPGIVVPLDPALIGVKFYIDCAQKDGGGDTAGVTGVIEVTLTAP